MRYLLDANAVIALLNDTSSNLARRARRERPSDMAIPAIVAHELFYGAYKSRRAAQNVALVDALQFSVLAFDREDARKSRGGESFFDRERSTNRPLRRVDRRTGGRVQHGPCDPQHG